MNTSIQKIVLAYSGGLDTSIIIAWLKEHYPRAEVTTVTVDLGQQEPLGSIRKKALESGADEALVIDVKEEFVQAYLWPLVKSGALYEKQYLLGTISRPLIAKKLADIALEKKADAICHGATGKGNDQVRFEYTIKGLAPHLKIIAPWRSWSIQSRQEAIEYAKAHNIPVPATPNTPYSRDQNIWYISHEGGAIEKLDQGQPDDVLLMTKTLEAASSTPEIIQIGFERGVPVSINGVLQKPLSLLKLLNELGAKHGIGVSNIIEDRLVGIKIRGIYEAPGASLIYKAHHILETLCLDRSLLALKHSLEPAYANLVYEGRWFSQAREALDAFFNASQVHLTGSVTLKLYKGNAVFEKTDSPYSLYHPDFATFEAETVYNQSDAEGFINLFSLPAKIYGLAHRECHES